MPAIITSIVTIAQAAFTWMSANTIAAFAVRTALTFGVSKLIANRAAKNASGSQASGARIQAAPSTLNKLPVVYGTAYMGGKIIDAKISIDQKKMWYVMALSEVTSTMPGETPDTFTFGDIYFNGKKCIFGDGTNTSKVTAVETNSDPVQQDDRISGKAYIWRFPNGSSSGIDTGGSSAITLLSDAEIPADLQWDSALYTTGGQSASMNNTCFVVVKIEYNDDVGTVGVPEVVVELTNSRTKPGDVIYDYLYNSVYGCGIPLANIDTASLTALNTYSDETITYVPVGGGSASQVRYRINGPIDTGQNCLSNLQDLCDSCDSWLQYSELNAKWKVVINKPYSGVLGDLYNVNSDVLVGGIDVNPIDLNETYNGLEVQYPDANIRDQVNTKFINLIDFAPEVMSPNEAINTLVIQYPLVNNYVQTVYLGLRRLLQGREDLTINFRLDYSGIQLEAGDVVRVNLAEYGWTDKLFRVSQVQETKDESGNLFANIIAFEYNGSIYADNSIQDYVPADNTGLTDPNIFDKPSTPIVTNGPIANGAINYYTVSSNVPAVGTTLYMDFNIGNNSNVDTHKSYTSVQIGDGTPYTANSTITINVADSSPGTYYWSTTARNKESGRQSNSSASFTWNGPSVSDYDANTGNGGIGINNINSSLNVTTSIGGTNFSILDSANTAIINPVNVTSTSTRNIPVIITGNTISSTNWYPWSQGTSKNTAGTSGNNYYAANSTSSWNPYGAGILLINDGEDGWYKVIYDDFSAGTVASNQTYFMNVGVSMVSDTDNTIVQMVYATKENPQTYYNAKTDSLETHVLYANLPVLVGRSQNFTGSVVANFNSAAVFVRVISSGNVTIVKGSLASSKGWNPY